MTLHKIIYPFIKPTSLCMEYNYSDGVFTLISFYIGEKNGERINYCSNLFGISPNGMWNYGSIAIDRMIGFIDADKDSRLKIIGVEGVE